MKQRKCRSLYNKLKIDKKNIAIYYIYNNITTIYTQPHTVYASSERRGGEDEMKMERRRMEGMTVEERKMEEK